MIFNMYKDDHVVGEILGEIEFGIYMEEIKGNCERWKIRDNSIHYFFMWLVSNLVGNNGEILRVKKNLGSHLMK